MEKTTIPVSNKMSKITSAGILLESRGKFLLGHPTELTGTTHGWGILKGKVDKGEQLINGAFREFNEESGLDLLAKTYIVYLPRPFYKYSVKSAKKTVFVFWVLDPNDQLYDYKFHCPSLVPGTNKPEIDRYYWATADEAIEMVTESQKDLFRTVKGLYVE